MTAEKKKLIDTIESVTEMLIVIVALVAGLVVLFQFGSNKPTTTPNSIGQIAFECKKFGEFKYNETTFNCHLERDNGN